MWKEMAVAKVEGTNYLGTLLERPTKTVRNLDQDSWSLGKDLNPGLPEYEARVLITRP
jgi:hypothetical protein